MSYIYWIRTNGGIYIGKYSEQSYMEYHMRRAEPFLDAKNLEEAWEKEWRFYFIHYGYHNDYIRSTNYFDESIVRQKLINSFDKILQDSPYNDASGEELYADVAAMWGRNLDYLAVTEALCILLGAKNIPNLLNTQVDFMTRKDLTNINNFFNRNEIQRIQEKVRKKWMPWIFFTFDFTDFDIGSIDEKLEKQLQNKIGTKSPINVLKHPKVVAALLPELGEHTIDSVVRQLNDYKKHLRDNRNIPSDSPIIRYVNKVIKNIKEGSFDNREQLINFIKKQFSSSTWTKKVERNYNMETVENKVDAILETLLLWYNNTSIYDILDFSSSDDDWVNKCSKVYRRHFTKYIQTVYFNRPEIPEYNNWRDEWIENRMSTHPLRPGALYPTFLKRDSEANLIDNTSLKQKIYTSIKTDEEFIRNNWDYIYPEQIAYCLTQKDANFELSDNIKTYNGFIDTIELENIQHY